MKHNRMKDLCKIGAKGRMIKPILNNKEGITMIQTS